MSGALIFFCFCGFVYWRLAKGPGKSMELVQMNFLLGRRPTFRGKLAVTLSLDTLQTKVSAMSHNTISGWWQLKNFLCSPRFLGFHDPI